MWFSAIAWATVRPYYGFMELSALNYNYPTLEIWTPFKR